MCRYLVSQNTAIRNKLAKTSQQADGDEVELHGLRQNSETLRKAADDWQTYHDEIGADNCASLERLLTYLEDQGSCTTCNWFSFRL